MGFIVITSVPYAFYTEIYDIQKPLPFHGNTWLNPYKSCSFDNDNAGWKKSNFHGHSKEWGGLTDGKTDKDVFLKNINQWAIIRLDCLIINLFHMILQKIMVLFHAMNMAIMCGKASCLHWRSACSVARFYMGTKPPS